MVVRKIENLQEPGQMGDELLALAKVCLYVNFDLNNLKKKQKIPDISLLMVNNLGEGERVT